MNREVLPPLGDEIAAHVRDHMQRKIGVPTKEAAIVADEVAELLLTVYAGQRVAFPADPFRGRYLEKRNSEIRRRFDGSNAPVLAVQYGLSRSQIYNIVKSDDSTA